MNVTVLVARQRSGTGALGSVFNQHPEIKYLGEVFHHHHIGAPENYFTHLLAKVREANHYILPSGKAELFAGFLEHLGTLSPKRHIVIDVKYSSLHHFNGFWLGPSGVPGFFELCKNFDVPVIHLTRRNLLKCYVSGILADQNRVWHLRPETGAKITIRTLGIDSNHLLHTLRAMQQELDALQYYLEDHAKLVTFDYEELFDGDGGLAEPAAAQICNLLGIGPFSGLRATHIKQTGDDLRLVIENFREIEDLLRDTPFDWMPSVEPRRGGLSLVA